MFQFQYQYNPVYKEFVDSIHINPQGVHTLNKIPFLPIDLFKTHRVTTTDFEEEVIFESSGTTRSVNSRHYVKDIDLYKENFIRIFEMFYGAPEEWCILGLLPSYLEKENSSLVMMVNHLINMSENSHSGFYLNDHEKLYHTLLHNEFIQQPTLLIGVTFGLLDFAEKYSAKLNHTVIMETGGMKGRRQELLRSEVHNILTSRFGLESVHSEYGMTELLSQAYSKGNGIFKSPPWMKVLLRDEDDPFTIKSDNSSKDPVTGLINIIDLANIYSCAFIATDDIGRLHPNGTFEVLGRSDNTDIRGCTLMAI
jgi:phenylacetate-coenzyme A ligase PaaK-like adenylate-forming protein